MSYSSSSNGKERLVPGLGTARLYILMNFRQLVDAFIKAIEIAKSLSRWGLPMSVVKY
jgi:hypothetical protein